MQSPVQQAVMQVGAVDASAAPKYYWVAPCQLVIESIKLVTTTGIAANANNIHTTTVKNLGLAGAGTDVVATRTTDSDVTGYGAITAKVPWTLVNSSTAGNLEVAAGEVLEIACTEGGDATSGDLADATFVINYRVGTGMGYS